MKIALCQMNPKVGDLKNNVNAMMETLKKIPSKVDVVVFPELVVTGYPPRDLLCQDDFIHTTMEYVLSIVSHCGRTCPDKAVIFGAPIMKDGVLRNSAVACRGGDYSCVHKSLLPSYDVFDETRYFTPATGPQVASVCPEIGITICEDAWNDPEFWPNNKSPYSINPVAIQAQNRNTRILVNISASPFHVGKDLMRYNLIRKHAQRHNKPFVYVNQVGGNDELIFDGRSMVVNANGDLIGQASAFEPDLRIVDLDASPLPFTVSPDVESVHEALICGVRDYFNKCGFEKAVVGLSGGIDSAVTASIAVDALGEDNVLGITMPSKFNDPKSKSISNKLGKNFGITVKDVPIGDLYTKYEKIFSQFMTASNGVTLENIQARIRGNILMAVSNEMGHLVLSTGNKSELAVGYCTLYGDMCGGMAVLSDVPKTMVYALAKWINRSVELIPDWIITRPPSAELRENQRDQDTLPDYPVLDEILRLYLECGETGAQIIERGYGAAEVYWVIEAVAKNEYKRRQAAPGLRVTTKAFGVGRRYPIAARVIV